MSDIWKDLKEWTGEQSNQELKRSQYSLVSREEAAGETLNLDLRLLEEINDEELGDDEIKIINSEKKPGPSVIKQADDSSPSEDELAELSNDTEVTNGEERRKKESVNRIFNRSSNKKQLIKIAQDKYYVRITILLVCWTFFTLIFLMYGEKRDITKSTAIVNGQDKNYSLQINNDDVAILLTLSGPFLSDNDEIKMDSNQLETHHKMEVWLERSMYRIEQNHSLKDFDQAAADSEPWVITLQDEKQLDFNKGVARTHKFHHKSNNTHKNNTYFIRLRSTSTRTVPFTISYTVSPLDVSTGVVYAVVLLLGLYVLIVFEIINRTMAAIIMATMSLAVLALVGERPSLPELISWLNEETLLLLFSMMLLVSVMAETGIFDYLAVYVFEVTRGKLWPLIYLLCGVTALLSTVLDNVAIVLLMSPVTIRLCEVMGLDPVHILMFMAIYSNVGGTATPVGDLTSVIVVSNKDVIEAGISFTNFTAHMSLGIVLVLIQTSLHIRYMYRDNKKLQLNVPRDIQDIRQQISIWRRAADSLPHLNSGVHIVRKRLEKKIVKLNGKLEVLVQENNKGSYSKEKFLSTLTELKGNYKIRDKVLLLKGSVSITFVVIAFFMHSIPEFNRVSLGWTALLGAILLLTLADRKDLEPILHRVEWSTLLFFAAIFVFIEALSKLGLILYIGSLVEQLVLRVDESARLAVAILLILWVSGIVSACVDNVPLTTMMVRVVVSMGSNPNLNLPTSPLIWALLYGACLGGNGTLLGASANVVCAGVAEQHGYKFTFSKFFKVGFPVMVGHLIIASIYLLTSHCLFTWH
ncbi:P protein-like [Achroia grisella]|uniref:P protein-like n=1 Tax=Achroia grisella TaxID=688607 RepID=UPI0027D209EB|nr:P protein-like [Achroia grisella]